MIDWCKNKWRWVRETARKILPNRAARWAFIWTPLFLGASWFGIKVIMGGGDEAADVLANLASTAPVSARAMVAVFFTYLLACAFRWNLEDAERERLQRVLAGAEEGSQVGAFVILAGETLAILYLLTLFLRALILWPMAIPTI